MNGKGGNGGNGGNGGSNKPIPIETPKEMRDKQFERARFEYSFLKLVKILEIEPYILGTRKTYFTFSVNDNHFDMTEVVEKAVKALEEKKK